MTHISSQEYIFRQHIQGANSITCIYSFLHRKLVVVHLSPITSTILSIYCLRGRPFLLFLVSCLSGTYFSSLILIMCHVTCIRRCLVVLKISLSISASSSTSSFLYLAVQGIRSILLHNHISIASMSSSFVVSTPYVHTGMLITYPSFKAFQKWNNKNFNLCKYRKHE